LLNEEHSNSAAYKLLVNQAEDVLAHVVQVV